MNSESDEEHSQVQDEQPNQRLQTAVWHQVNEIVKDQVAKHLNKDVSEAFVASLAEVVMTQMQTMATDLEAFAVHGKRAVISMEDVKLCARRNDSLYELITETANDIAGESTSRKQRR
ncbi:kinetochore component CENP-S-domain-containing protein [Mucor lusitanicus]|uniref:Centromere protein S n=2 Tax=Mucor circinelloides f. lusitanicus TaxID=29924 RepID=A0A168LR49_MUCCL|nr:kinetochore component CENP-S-domain-containing protein [Mucor lusitanicus]OAD03858.1 hypothetical protein MUCCIDRAFT_110734 [Mucor lusitanicus CBS 277.49]